jgi:hypothetical protein
MDRQPVASSDLRSVGYEEEQRMLEIAFRSGGVYQYFGVSPGEYRALMAAGSKGSYFSHNIKPRYRYRKVG